MKLFNKFKLSKAIQERKKDRLYMRIEKINRGCYYLRDTNGKTYTLNIDFFDMEPMPSTGDGFYLSENMVENMNENLYYFTFSTQIGKEYAREPHDFLLDPQEFLIFEYANGKTFLLKRRYG